MKNKIPDCENCEYSNQNIGEKWCAGGHCYMFKEIMLDCKQFKLVKDYSSKNKENKSE